jgi:hypothetical protein
MPKVSLSPNGRAGCQTCANFIGQGDLRVQKAQRKYQHFHCFMKDRKRKQAVALDGVSDLEPEARAIVAAALDEANGKVATKRQQAKARAEKKKAATKAARTARDGEDGADDDEEDGVVASTVAPEPAGKAEEETDLPGLSNWQHYGNGGWNSFSASAEAWMNAALAGQSAENEIVAEARGHGKKQASQRRVRANAPDGSRCFFLVSAKKFTELKAM